MSAAEAAGGGADRRAVAYAGVALLAATSYAIGSTSARIAYEAGSDALSVSSARTMIAAIVLFLFLRARGVRLVLARRERVTALLLGPLLASYSFCLYAAIGFIPVALGVLTFYTFPLLSGIFSWALGTARPTRRTGAALVVAFLGLLLALDIVGGTRLDPRGIALALLGATLLASLLLATQRLFPPGDSRPRTLHILASAALCFLVICVLSGHFALPRTPTGSVAFATSLACYCVAVVCMFAASATLGPVKTGLLMNLEPVASMLLGVVVLGQELRPIQLLGAALVLGAILLGRAPAAVQAKR